MRPLRGTPYRARRLHPGLAVDLHGQPLPGPDDDGGALRQAAPARPQPRADLPHVQAVLEADHLDQPVAHVCVGTTETVESRLEKLSITAAIFLLLTLHGQAEVHRVAGRRGEFPGGQRPGGLAPLAAALARLVVPPEVGAAVRVGDVEQRHALQRLAVGHVQGHAIALGEGRAAG